MICNVNGNITDHDADKYHYIVTRCDCQKVSRWFAYGADHGRSKWYCHDCVPEQILVQGLMQELP